MTAQQGSGGAEQRRGEAFELPVPERGELFPHRRPARQQPEHRKSTPLEIGQRFEQIKVTAALAVNRAAGRGKGADRRQHRRIRRQPFGIKFRVTAAEIKPVEPLRQRPVVQRRKRNRLHPKPPEQFEILPVVEQKRLVARHAETGPDGRKFFFFRQIHRLRTRGRKQTVEVDRARQRIGERVEPGVVKSSDGEPEMTFGENPALVAFDSAEQRREPGGFERSAQKFRVPGRADVVRNHPDDPHAGPPFGKSANQGRNGAGHAARIHGENHREVEECGDLGAAPGVGAGGVPVEEPHHTFDHGDTGPGGMPGEAAPDTVGAGEKGVEIERITLRRLTVKQGVDVVRPALERRDGESPPGEGAQQPERQRGLAAPGVGPGDQKP